MNIEETLELIKLIKPIVFNSHTGGLFLSNPESTYLEYVLEEVYLEGALAGQFPPFRWEKGDFLSL